MRWTPLTGATIESLFKLTGSTRRKSRQTRRAERRTKIRPAIETLESRVTPDVSASIVGSSLASTAGGNATIGEIVRIRVVADENLSGDYNPSQFNITAAMPGGLQFLPGTADIALMSDQGMTSTLDPSGTGINVTGGDPTGVHPTFSMPSSAIGIDPTTGALTFNTGISHVNDNDANEEFVIIEYNALVKNVATNQGSPPSDLSVNFQLSINGQQAAVGAVPITVVEPSIADLAKSAQVSGGVATYTVTFTNSGTSAAYDAHVVDSLPAGLSLNSGSVMVGGAAIQANASGGNKVDVTLGEIDPGASVAITYTASFNTSDVVTNTATLTYTSLPGSNGTSPNPTGSTTPGAPGSDTGERDGSGGIDDYLASASVTTNSTGNPPPTTSIHGFVFFDPNCNGHKSPGEPGLPGVHIRLTDINGNPVTDVNGHVVGIATTGADGSYQFIDLPVGTFRLIELPPQPLFNGGPTEDGITSAGNVNGVTVGTALRDVITNITLSAGQESFDNNFGECPVNVGSISLSGHVYFDTNRDRVRDAGDLPIGGAQLVLFRTDLPGLPVRVAQTTTNDRGEYLFNISSQGTYRVLLAPVANLIKEVANVGLVRGILRGTAPTIDDLDAIALFTGDNGINYDFGLINQGTPPNSKQDLLANIPGGPMMSPFAATPSFANDPPMSDYTHLMATGAGAGAAPIVRVFDFTSGKQLFTLLAYNPSFLGGVRVAVGDVNGDGVPDIITAPGAGGGPNVRVFDGKTGAMIRSFMAYNGAFTGGVFVAAGDVNGDGIQDIITGAGAGGGPMVKVFNGATGAPIASFFAYNQAFTGGVTVASGDFNADGQSDVVVGAGPGGGPQVKIFNSASIGKPTLTTLASFFAFNPGYSGGVNVAANDSGQGDFNGDGRTDLVVGTASGFGQVKVIDGTNFSTVATFNAFAASQAAGGVSVAVFDLNNDGKADIVAGAGGGAGALVRVLKETTGQDLEFFQAFNPAFLGGVWVGAA